MIRNQDTHTEIKMKRDSSDISLLDLLKGGGCCGCGFLDMRRARER